VGDVDVYSILIGICRDENLPLIIRFFPLLSKIFGNEMCQTWSKQLENEDYGALYIERGSPLSFINEHSSAGFR
jgi:hypothetical protein